MPVSVSLHKPDLSERAHSSSHDGESLQGYEAWCLAEAIRDVMDLSDAELRDAFPQFDDELSMLSRRLVQLQVKEAA